MTKNDNSKTQCDNNLMSALYAKVSKKVDLNQLYIHLPIIVLFNLNINSIHQSDPIES